jgi:hypothetical protein
MSIEPRLDAIIRFYEQKHRDRAIGELRSFADEPTLASAVSRAGLAVRKDGKRYNHQRRIPAHVLQAARENLLVAPLATATSFHELFVTVQRAIGEIPGVGELMVYDTAFRIGARLRLEPERIYLHSGTRVGARRLGLDSRAKSVDRGVLPVELRHLPSWQVEDILCIFKEWFTGEMPNHQVQQTSARRCARSGPRC